MLLTENCRNKLKSVKKWQNPGYRGKNISDVEFSRGTGTNTH